MDRIFSYAFIQALTLNLPPELARRVEKVCAEQGFDFLLSAYFASPKAMERLLRSVTSAVEVCERSPTSVATSRRRIMDGVSLGAAAPGEFELPTKHAAASILYGQGDRQRP